MAVPTIAIDPICHQINDILDKKTIIINVSKGFHPETNERMSEVIRRCIDEDKLSSVVSLIGPSHAEEVVIRLLTTIDAISLNNEDAVTVQNLFSNQYLRIYTGNDEIGSELGVAIKNVMAIASGILSGLNDSLWCSFWWATKNVHGSNWNWRLDCNLYECTFS